MSIKKNKISGINKEGSKNSPTVIDIDTLFVGGGPATLGVLANAYQTNRIEPLIRAGIAIVEASDQFGGGNLQKHFGIKSNTSATGFLKVIMYPKQRLQGSPTRVPQSAGMPTGAPVPQANITSSHANSIFPAGSSEVRNNQYYHQSILSKTATFSQKSQVKFTTQKQEPSREDRRKFLPQFADFAENSEIVKSLLRYGKKVAPLQLIGTFLSYAGNQMLNDIYQQYKKKVFYGRHKAVKIQQITANNEIYWLTEVQSIQNPTSRIVFKSRKVILATGAKQNIPMNFRLNYALKESCSVYTSDQILKNEGFTKVVREIRKSNGKCKIAILGASHSAFSVIYTLLNGPCKINVFEEMLKKNRQAGSNRKINSAIVTQSSQLEQLKLKAKEGHKISVCTNCPACPLGQTHSIHQKCSCGQSCLCLSAPQIKYDLKAQQEVWPILTGDDKIQIIYRRQIKVHYANQAQASNDYYNDYDKNLDLSKGGIVYPFTGIRGDSKELWNKCKKGQLPHVELIKAESLAEQQTYMREIDIAIIACGYESNGVQVLDQAGSQVPLYSSQQYCGDGGQTNQSPSCVDVNTNCNLVNALSNRPISGLYGIGQGYSLATNDLSVQAEPRIGAKADSVGLYIKQIGNKILNQILPNQKIQYAFPEGTSQDFRMIDSQSNQKSHQYIQLQPGAIQNGTQNQRPLVKPGNQLFSMPASNVRSHTQNPVCPKTQTHHSAKFQILKSPEKQKQNINGRNSFQGSAISRGIGAPLSLHGRYLHDFVNNNSNGQYQNTVLQQPVQPLLKQQEVVTSQKKVKEEIFAQSLQTQQQMMNSPLLYSDKKYKGIQTTGKKTSLKKSKLSGQSSGNKKQQVLIKPNASLNMSQNNSMYPNQLESLIDNQKTSFYPQPMRQQTMQQSGGGDTTNQSSYYQMVLQHGSKGIQMANVNQNQLFPTNTQSNSRSNFTHYEEKLLANHSKSKNSIEVSNKNSILPSQSQLCGNVDDAKSLIYPGTSKTPNQNYEYSFTSVKQKENNFGYNEQFSNSLKTKTTYDGEWSVQSPIPFNKSFGINQNPSSLIKGIHSKAPPADTQVASQYINNINGYPLNTFPLRGGGAEIIRQPKAKPESAQANSNFSSPSMKPSNKKKNGWTSHVGHSSRPSETQRPNQIKMENNINSRSLNQTKYASQVSNIDQNNQYGKAVNSYYRQYQQNKSYADNNNFNNGKPQYYKKAPGLH